MRRRHPLGRNQLSSNALYVARHGYDGIAPQERRPQRRRGDDDGNGEDDGTSSSATARRNANPVGVAKKDGTACNGRDGGAL